MEKLKLTIQQVQGEVLHVREDLQEVFTQLSDLSFKFSTMMAKWQQQREQSSSTLMDQSRREQEGVT